MQQLVIASNSEGKIREIRQLVSELELLSLSDVGFSGIIDEPYHTFEQNALVKAETIHRFSGKNVFADDSGICVNALGGEPGVQSAYFGGLPRSDAKNNEQLLASLQDSTDRSAFYKAVICLIWEGKTYFFEGVCEGAIGLVPEGSGGFGYDPLFIPAGYEHSFGVLPAEVKNEMSHRGKAIRKMVAFIKERMQAL